MITVKYKRIKTQYFNGKIETEDTIYNLKISKIKLIKWLLRNEFRFSVGIRGNELVSNLDYIEVWSDHFFKKNHYEKNKLIVSFLNNCKKDNEVEEDE